MAISEHVDIVKNGAEAIEEWRQRRLRKFKRSPEAERLLTEAGLRENILRDESDVARTVVRAAWQALFPFDLREAELSKAKLSKVDLSNAKFDGANLSETDFFEATLNRVSFDRANLTRAFFKNANLRDATFVGATLSGTDFQESELTDANLSGAILRRGNFYQAKLLRTNFANADLSGADLGGADLADTNFEEALLIGSRLVRANALRTNFRRANLSQCRIYGISVWGCRLDEAIQNDLIIAPGKYDLLSGGGIGAIQRMIIDERYESTEEELGVTVDNLEVAQFIYLILNNNSLRNAIDTITSKVVLILGRFTKERKAVLDAIREDLRRRNLTPVLFDFEKPVSKDVTGTVETLARMAKFIIADLTDPSSIPHELATIVPYLRTTPVLPLRRVGSEGYSMFDDLQRAYKWVLSVHEYDDVGSLLLALPTVIAPAQEMAEELRRTR